MGLIWLQFAVCTAVIGAAGYPRASIYTLAAQSHILSAGFGVILIGIVAISVLAGDPIPAIGHVGLYTPVVYSINSCAPFMVGE